MCAAERRAAKPRNHSDPRGLARLQKRFDDEGKYTRQEQADSA